ncbi:nicotinate-nucleotide adenylyltransferase [Leptolyngbya sp. FACHB-261]|nr:nicotinate-nucleotide adenylyltransferase [Leptolyngbya sp. FACHB-261]
MPQTIALFGTSADPPTIAHGEIVAWLADHFDRVAVWASDNPFKQHQTYLRHRLHMLELLLSDLQRSNVQLEPDLGHPRALITVQRARERWPDAHLTLVIGSDLVAQLPRWYCVEELLMRVQLLIVPRPGYQLRAADLAAVQALGGQYWIAELTGLPVSSTAYREGDREAGVSAPVQAYIEQEQLYSCQDVAVVT